METVSYVPKLCEGEGAPFKGCVVLRKPGYEEKLELHVNQEILEIISDAEEGKTPSKMTPKEAMAMVKMVRWSYQFFEKVDITRIKDKVYFKDLDSLRYDSSCGPILQDIAMKLVHGFQLGNG